MNMEQDAANLVVNQTMMLTIEGTKMLLTLSGKGAVRVAAMLAAVLQEQHRTKGAVRLNTLLKSGGVEIFTIPEDKLAEWAQAAKNYGIMYTVMKDRDLNDGMIDLAVHTDDAPRINRIVERHGIALTPVATVTAEPAPEQEITAPAIPSNEGTLEQETEKILTEILAAPEVVRDEAGELIEQVLEPDVPEEEFNALFRDELGHPHPDLEELQDPQSALLNDSLSGQQSIANQTGGAKATALSETSFSPQQGSEWTYKRVKEEWPFSYPREAFNKEQLFQINKGFMDGLSVEKIAGYAKPEIYAEEMEALRKNLRPSVMEYIDKLRAAQEQGKTGAEIFRELAQVGKEM